MILNHFIDRRIGFQTMTTFRIKLNVKLNEIMPVYNKMFDMLDGWEIFNSGEQITRTVNESRNGNTNSTTTTNSQTSSANTKDIRKSDTPQNELEDVQNGSYVTDYEYKTDNTSATDSSSNTGTSQTTNQGAIQESITKTPGDKLKLYTEFIEKRQHIYSMIFKELDCLFYQLV